MRPMKRSPASNETSELQQAIDEKQHEFYQKSILYQRLYYGIRLSAALSAGLIPFAIRSWPSFATALSIGVVVASVIDSVFDPHARWKNFSYASDELFRIQASKNADYAVSAEALKVILTAEQNGTAKGPNVAAIVKAASADAVGADGESSQD